MALIFKNGGAPNYTGELFRTHEQLLISIRDMLVAAGWTTLQDSITGSNLLVSRGVSANGDFCYFRFDILDWAGVINGKYLRIRGDLDGGGTNLSPGFNFYFIEDADNIIFATADSDSGCLFTECFDGTKSNAHFGFMNRPAPGLDTFGWCIGEMDWRYNNVYWAKAVRNAQPWRKVGDDYYYPDNMGQGRNNISYVGVADRFTVGFSLYGDSSRDHYNGYNRNSNKNNAYYFWNGSLSPIDNKPILGEFYYLEGRGATNYGSSDQGTQLSSRMYFRGNIKHVVVGLSSLRAKTQITDNAGRRYITVGNNGYQGFRIA